MYVGVGGSGTSALPSMIYIGDALPRSTELPLATESRRFPASFGVRGATSSVGVPGVGVPGCLPVGVGGAPQPRRVGVVGCRRDCISGVPGAALRARACDCPSRVCFPAAEVYPISRGETLSGDSCRCRLDARLLPRSAAWDLSFMPGGPDSHCSSAKTDTGDVGAPCSNSSSPRSAAGEVGDGTSVGTGMKVGVPGACAPLLGSCDTSVGAEDLVGATVGTARVGTARVGTARVGTSRRCGEVGDGTSVGTGISVGDAGPSAMSAVRPGPAAGTIGTSGASPFTICLACPGRGRPLSCVGSSMVSCRLRNVGRAVGC